MHTVPSNFTPREEFAVYGTLRADVQERLIERAEALDEVSGIAAHVQEAAGCYPAEGLLSEEMVMRRKLADRLRGDNRDALHGIIERMRATLEDVQRNAEYGADELRQAREIAQRLEA